MEYKIETLEDLKKAKNNFYSNEGEVFKLKQLIKNASPEEKKKIGQKLKLLNEEANIFFETKQKEIKQKEIDNKIKNEWIDIDKPVMINNFNHPLEMVSKKFREWFLQNGYFESTGSEIESDEYNFEKLNIPLDHPARDMQDSLYINNKYLLRTHNTGLTARELVKNKNKEFSQFALGNVYRNDEDDATHSHQFMQVDLVCVGNGINFSNLIWTLKSLMSYVLEQEVEIRLRPSFFPFTEPSVEVDVKYNDKWIEVLGAGMLHPNVLKINGYTNDMIGFAAGIGVERITMIKYNIPDIREFYKNDIRFLQQFKRGDE